MRSPEPARSSRPELQGRPALGVALGGFALTLGALLFGAAPLFIPGVAFILLGLLALTWVWVTASGAVARRRLLEHRIVEGEPLEAVITIRRGHFGLPGAELDDDLAGDRVHVAEGLALAGGRRRLELRVVARVPRRGRHLFAPPVLRVSDPLGLARATVRGAGGTDQLLVLPRTEPIAWLARADHRLGTGEDTVRSREPTRAGEVDGLRPYRPGTRASLIHWPTLARGAGLQERRLVSATEARPLVVLDARSAVTAEGEAMLDAAVRAAASLTLELARHGGCALLLPGSRVPFVLGPDLAAWPALHTRLALVDAEVHPERAPALRPEVARGRLIYVAARLDSRNPMPPAGSRASGTVLVVPLALGGTLAVRPSFQVAGCGGYVLAARGRRRAA